MANIEMTPHGPGRSEERHRSETAQGVVAGGSTAESIAGLGAVVLAILALLGLLPLTLVSIATIAIGAGLLLRSMAIGASLTQMRHEIHSEHQLGPRPGRGAGVTIEMLGGLAVIALGILSLLRLDPAALLPISAIVFGGSLIFAAGTTTRVAELRAWYAGSDLRSREVEREAARSSASVEVLVGIGAVVLGILSLVGVGATFLLVVIANLAVGAALLLSGAVLGTRVASRTM